MENYTPQHKYSFKFPKMWDYFDSNYTDTPFIKNNYEIKWTETHQGVEIKNLKNHTSFIIPDAPPIQIRYNDLSKFCDDCRIYNLSTYSTKKVTIPSFIQWCIIMEYLDDINRIFEAHNKMPFDFQENERLLCRNFHHDKNKCYFTYFNKGYAFYSNTTNLIMNETFVMTPLLTKLIIN
jgi:hypothetical protein